VTGHSLGGVMALFAALSLELRGRPVALLYTVGQPRPGNQAFAQFVRDLLGRRYVRLEGLRDITPQVPPTAHNADAFARLISERAPRLRAGLAAALRRLGYAALAGPAFLVGDDGSFERLDGRELTREASYWDELAHHFRTNLPLEQWLRPLVERFSEHRPRHYLCTLGRALATAGRW
jgi:thioesterase domain-containing protein